MQITPCVFPHLGHLFSHYCVLTSLPHSPTRGKGTDGDGGGDNGGDGDCDGDGGGGVH